MVGVGVDHAGFLADDMKVDIIVTASGGIGRPVSVNSLDGGRDVKGFAPYRRGKVPVVDVGRAGIAKFAGVAAV